MEATTANITNRLKIMAAGVALAASGFVLGATGAAWADSDKTGEAGACNMEHAAGAAAATGGAATVSADGVGTGAASVAADHDHAAVGHEM